MGRIHLNRDRQNLGQFTPEQVAEGLASGRFLPTDLAWREGMEGWQPLSTLSDLPAVILDPTPTTLSEEPAVEAPSNTTMQPFPWDRRKESGFFSALGETVLQSLGRPGSVFKNLAQPPPMLPSWLFYLFVAMPSFAIYAVEVLIFLNYAMAAVATAPELQGNPDTARAFEMLQNFGVPWFGFLLLFVVPLVPLVAAGAVHLLLMLFGGAKETLATTFATTCYVFGSASPLLILPCCGPVAAVVWSMIALGIGLGVAHRTDSWRSMLAAAVPFVFCCGSYIALNFLATAGRLAQ